LGVNHEDILQAELRSVQSAAIRTERESPEGSHRRNCIGHTHRLRIKHEYLLDFLFAIIGNLDRHVPVATVGRQGVRRWHYSSVGEWFVSGDLQYLVGRKIDRFDWTLSVAHVQRVAVAASSQRVILKAFETHHKIAVNIGYCISAIAENP